MGAVETFVRKIRLVGRNQRQVPGVGPINELRLGQFLFGHPVALYFNIEAVLKRRCHGIKKRIRIAGFAHPDQAPKNPVCTATQGNQVACMRAQFVQGDTRTLCILTIHISDFEQRQQVQIPVIGLCQQDNAAILKHRAVGGLCLVAQLN